jgi:hypothetical protein
MDAVGVSDVAYPQSIMLSDIVTAGKNYSCTLTGDR